MNQITTDFDLSEQGNENTATSVRIFKELQVLDAATTVTFSDQEVTTAIHTARQVTVTKPDGTEETFQFASSESPIVNYLTATVEGDELVLTTTTGHVSNTRYLTAEVQNNILYFKEGD